jgi:alpha-L-fucosidase
MLLASAALVLPLFVRAANDLHKPLRVQLRQQAGVTSEQWKPAETAIIVCDMWDRHWCDSATARVAEMAPVMNEVLTTARRKGITIVHAPSDCMAFYKDYPQRKTAAKYKNKEIAVIAQGDKLPAEAGATWPVDQSGGGCDGGGTVNDRVWTKQIDALTIAAHDLISDSGEEIGAYFKQKGIKNVILMGVHTNMCIVSRTFGLRAMTRMGMRTVLMRDMTDLMYNPRLYPYVNHFAGLDLMINYIEKYICPTIVSTDLIGRPAFVFATAQFLREQVKNDRARGIVLPKNDYHYKVTRSYVEDDPDADYLHASDAAHEAFRDIKFSVRIHWGIYSIWEMNGESWGFLRLSNAKKQEYNNLYKTFNPTGFDANTWMSIFNRAGLQGMAFTTKHHEGFSMFDTKTRVVQCVNYLDTAHVIESCDLAYSIVETPFKRDVVKELCDAAHVYGIKIDLYFSHPDWYDADFRPYNSHPLTTPDLRDNTAAYGDDIHFDPSKIMTPDRTPEETARLVARHREQLRELLTNYGKIDMICLDQWLGSDIWPETKATLNMVRQLQPNVMLRCRGIGNYGDYYTPEGFVPGSKENTNMPWMTIYPLASSFSYDKNGDKYKGAPWIIHNLIDAVAKGGSFMVGIGPDGTGCFHPKAVEQLEETGRWLAVNGAAIYNTRPCDVWKEENIRFTRTKDHKQVFAMVEEWPGKELTISSVSPKTGSPVYLLGYDEPLQWAATDEGVKISIPDELQLPKNRPCNHAWAFSFDMK